MGGSIHHSPGQRLPGWTGIVAAQRRVRLLVPTPTTQWSVRTTPLTTPMAVSIASVLRAEPCACDEYRLLERPRKT